MKNAKKKSKKNKTKLQKITKNFCNYNWITKTDEKDC